jgi:hypothetical protein
MAQPSAYNKADFPVHLHGAVDDANYTLTEEFLRPLRLMKASPQHLFEGMAKSSRGQDKISIWLGSKDYTQSWRHPAGHCGFVKAADG